MGDLWCCIGHSILSYRLGNEVLQTLKAHANMHLAVKNGEWMHLMMRGEINTHSDSKM